MKISSDISFNDLKELLKAGDVSKRSFVSIVKQRPYLHQGVLDSTHFLDDYEPTFEERLVYVSCGFTSVICCKYCGAKLKYTGRMNKPFRSTCGSKECIAKELAVSHTGSTVISDTRDDAFKKWQASIKKASDLNDDTVKEKVCYDRYLSFIDNPILLDYINTRFPDSETQEETLKRIELHIEKKPLCPICGNPVKFVGRKNKMFTTYCSNSCAGNAEETKQKKKAALLENWGSENCYDSEKYKAIVREKYGVDYISQVPEVIAKKKKTFLEKYGVEYVSQNKEIQKKIWETYKEHQTFNTSDSEDEIYEMLKTLGYSVQRHIRIEEYPFNVDYYLSDYNVYIEYQGSQFHHGRAFLNTDEDKRELDSLYARADKKREDTGKEISQYDSIIDTWVKRDPMKRMYAYEHNVNLLEIFAYNNIDDIHDQVNLYINMLKGVSPLKATNDALDAEYNFYKKLHIDDISKVFDYSGKRNVIVKHFQGNEFFKEEMKIYAKNPILRRKLIQNRMKYLNKTELELTPDDILTGFKKSAIYYGYSHFNPKLTNWFVNKFGVRSVYDPCGGWGHHLLGMLNCDRIVYNDLSAPTYENVLRMRDYFGMDNLECRNEDAASYSPDPVDAFFMCPPYYNLEKYDCGGFSSMDEYASFLNKVFGVWEKNSAKLFGLVLREDFYQLLDGRYKDMVSEARALKTVTSHLVKSKKYREYFYIFKKR